MIKPGLKVHKFLNAHRIQKYIFGIHNEIHILDRGATIFSLTIRYVSRYCLHDTICIAIHIDSKLSQFRDHLACNLLLYDKAPPGEKIHFGKFSKKIVFSVIFMPLDMKKVAARYTGMLN